MIIIASIPNTKHHNLKIFLTILFMICFQGIAMAQADEQEADLKAAFIYNFTHYIDWDPAVEEYEFVIGVIGPSSVVNSLNQIAKNNFVKNKRILIHVFNKPEEINHCDILFISQNCPFPLQAILNKTDRGMLTISEQAGYAKEGTAFNFVLINDKLKFEANLKAINSTGLKAGSQLLKLAIIVD